MGISATEARWKGGNDGRVGPGRPGVEGREELVSRTRETQTAAKPTESVRSWLKFFAEVVLRG